MLQPEGATMFCDFDVVEARRARVRAVLVDPAIGNQDRGRPKRKLTFVVAKNKVFGIFVLEWITHE